MKKKQPIDIDLTSIEAMKIIGETLWELMSKNNDVFDGFELYTRSLQSKIYERDVHSYMRFVKGYETLLEESRRHP